MRSRTHGTFVVRILLEQAETSRSHALVMAAHPFEFDKVVSESAHMGRGLLEQHQAIKAEWCRSTSKTCVPPLQLCLRKAR